MSDTVNQPPASTATLSGSSFGESTFGISNFDFMDVATASESANDLYSANCAEIQLRAKNAEANIKSDPRIAGFYARNALELMVETVFDIDNWLTRPRHDATLMSLIHDKGFKQNLSSNLFPKLKLIIKIGNESVLQASQPMTCIQRIVLKYSYALKTLRLTSKATHVLPVFMPVMHWS